jgi:hypothetical protein
MSFGVNDRTCTLLKVATGEGLERSLTCSEVRSGTTTLLNHSFEVYPDRVEAGHSQQINLVLEPDMKGIRIL